MVLDLMIIGLAITLEPITIAAFILILGAEKGTRKGLAFILGWLACLVVVIAVVVLVTGASRRSRALSRRRRPWWSKSSSASC